MHDGRGTRDLAPAEPLSLIEALYEPLHPPVELAGEPPDLGLAGQRGRHRNPVQTRSRRGLDAVLIER